MELRQEKSFLNRYHFDARDLKWEEEHGKPGTKVGVNFQSIQLNKKDNRTTLTVILNFIIVFDSFVISGMISQLTHILDRLIRSSSEFTNEEVKQLSRSNLDMLNRLTYEITEIALDLPGVHLEF